MYDHPTLFISYHHTDRVFTQLNTTIPIFVAGGLLGANETLVNGLCASTIMKTWKGKSVTAALAVFRVVSAIGTAASYLILLFVSYEYVAMILMGILLIGIGMYVLFFVPRRAAEQESL